MEKLRLIGTVFIDEDGNEYQISSRELHEECLKYLHESQVLRIRDIFCNGVERLFPGMQFIPNNLLRSSPLFLEIEETISNNEFYVHLKEISEEDRIKAKEIQSEFAAYKAAKSIVITRRKPKYRNNRFFQKKG